MPTILSDADPHRFRVSRCARTGFTLIELLVVVAIIGLLSALSVPALMAVKAAARATTCASSLRQMGIAWNTYTDANGGRFPRTYHDGDAQSWVYRLAPYMEDLDSARICPEDTKGDVRLANKGTSYVLNGYVSMNLPGAVSQSKQLNAPSKTIVVVEGSDDRDADSFYFEHCHPDGWFKPAVVAAGKVWVRLTQEIMPNRHQGSSAHYLYADGHVVGIPEQTIHQAAMEGRNFMLPDQGAFDR